MANTNMMEREFGWDDVIENDGPAWVLLPEGTYPFTVTKLERKRYPGGEKLPPCWKAELTIAVEGAEGTANIQHNLFLHSKCEGLLCAFFTAIGDRKHGQPLKMDWDHVVGKKGICKVGIREWIDKNGSSRQSNEIKEFLDTNPQPGIQQTAGQQAPVMTPSTVQTQSTAPAGKYW